MPSLLAPCLVPLLLTISSPSVAPASAGPGDPAASALQQTSEAGAGKELRAESTLFLHPVRHRLEDGGYVTIERGLLQVPIRRSDPGSKPIAIEVYRFRAAEGADPDTPPLFQLHGGPGWPGLASVLEEPGGYERRIQPMTRVSDLVVVGQRGIGSSVPDTRCTESAAGDLSGLEPEARWEAVRDACRACRTFWEQQGYDLRGLNVIEAAADVDDVRRHLGYERITLWGGSFGSHWGMAVMRYFPEGVARAVLHGMEGPDHTYDMPSGVLGALKRMAAEAEEHVPGLRERLPEGGLIEALWILAESLDEEGVEVEVGGREEPLLFDGEALRDCALGVTARVNSRRGARTWAADVLELFEGNFERAAQTVARQGDGGSRGLPTASFFMLDCGSGISLARWDTLSNDPAAQIVGRLGEWYHETCKAWDSDLGDAFRAGFTTDIPTVIVHGTWDVSTPFDNALELLGTFEQHTFVVVEGGTHGALREAMDFSSEFSDALFEFVVSGDRSGLPKEIRFPPIEWAGPR